MAQRALTAHDLSCLEELPGATLSPDGRWLAYVRTRPRATATFHKYDFLGGCDRADVWIADAAGGAPQNLTHGARDGSGHWAPQWSADGRRLALLSTRGDTVCAWVCDIASRELHRVSARAVDLGSRAAPLVWVSDSEILLATLPAGQRPNRMTVEIRAAEIAMREWPKAWRGLEPTSIVWTGADSSLTFARPAQAPSPARADWWLLASGDEPRNLSAGLAAAPTRLFAEDGRRSFVGLGDEGVLRLTLSDGAWSNVIAGFQRNISTLLWPPPRESDRRTVARLVVVVDGEESQERYSLDLRSGALTPVRWPSDGAWLLHFSPEHDTAVYGAFDRTGARLWISERAFGRNRPIVETNTWLTDVAEGELRRVDYRGLEGDELTGWLILPIDHRPGMRHPLITSVYPGFVFGREQPTMLSIAGHHANNPQLLAARGYAVLFPSMPLGPEGEQGNPRLDVAKGVLPALEAAIEMGIADPGRLGLMGHSYGGYGTYALVTQTARFKAAVAMAGLADLVSLYGQFDARFRYDDDAHEHLLQMSLAETGQLRMGASPWQDPQRYVRNSPLFEVGDVQTPLLIIQGDMDYVPLQQGEQFFSALYRQGKRARFVRYWGEGHVFQSPANIEDMWQHIVGWYDEFLA